jgi:dienelactone hydrolase
VRRAAALLLLLPVAACGGAERPPAAPPGPFSYDASAPLAATERQVADKGGVRTYDVTFRSAGSTVGAYLLEPSEGATGPPVVYLHGGGGNRSDLLPVAVGWVRDGGRALLIDAAPTRAAATPLARLQAEHDAQAATVVRVRRAVDYLRAERVGLVGWSAGARTGAIVAGVERRIDAFVLMSGGAVPVDAYAAQAPAALRDDVRRLLGEVDPLRWVRRARPGTLFFQLGTKDEVVPRDALDALADAAPAPRRVRRYDAAHALNARAYADGYAWLSAKLSP